MVNLEDGDLTLDKLLGIHTPHDQGSHQNTLISRPTNALFVSTVNNEAIYLSFRFGVSL